MASEGSHGRGTADRHALAGGEDRADEGAAVSQRGDVDRHGAIASQEVERVLHVRDRHWLALRRPIGRDDDRRRLDPEDLVDVTGRRGELPADEIGQDGDGLAIYYLLRSWRREEGRHGGLQRG